MNERKPIRLPLWTLWVAGAFCLWAFAGGGQLLTGLLP